MKNCRRPEYVIHRRADGNILHLSAVEPMMNRHRPDDVIHQRADVDPMRKSVVGPKKSRWWNSVGPMMLYIKGPMSIRWENPSSGRWRADDETASARWCYPLQCRCRSDEQNYHRPDEVIRNRADEASITGPSSGRRGCACWDRCRLHVSTLRENLQYSVVASASWAMNVHVTNNEDVTHGSHGRIDGQQYYYMKTKWELDRKVARNVRNSRRHEDIY